MSDVTGGLCQVVSNMKALLSAIELIIPKQTGVILNFDIINMNNSAPITPPPPTNSLHKLVSVRPNAGGFWPLPEGFWPDSNMSALVRYQ